MARLFLATSKELAAFEFRSALFDKTVDAFAEIEARKALFHFVIGDVQGLRETLEIALADLAFHNRQRPGRDLGGKVFRRLQSVRHQLVRG